MVPKYYGSNLTPDLSGITRKHMNLPEDKNSEPLPNYDLDKARQSVGLYSKEEIEKAKYHKYARFGRILDPYGRLNNTREYLFFVKPDLHLTERSSFILNPELSENSYLQSLVTDYPDVVRQLQASAKGASDIGGNFCPLLSFGVNSSLELPSTESTTMDNPSNVMGVTYDYLGDAEDAENNHSFSLEFVDTKELEIYHFFRGFAEYQIERKSGNVTPPSEAYRIQRRLHNTMGIYKFLVDEDMETIIYWAYCCGVLPLTVPKEAFSDPTFSDGLTFSISFKAAFVEDMKTTIIRSFNSLMGFTFTGNQDNDQKLIDDMKSSIIPIYNINTPMAAGQSIGVGDGYVDGELPSRAVIIRTNKDTGRFGRSKYKLAWLR